jgi:hypothetical protein
VGKWPESFYAMMWCCWCAWPGLKAVDRRDDDEAERRRELELTGAVVGVI